MRLDKAELCRGLGYLQEPRTQFYLLYWYKSTNTGATHKVFREARHVEHYHRGAEEEVEDEVTVAYGVEGVGYYAVKAQVLRKRVSVDACVCVCIYIYMQ